MKSCALRRLVTLLVGLGAFALAGCAAEDQQQVLVVDSSNQSNGAGFGVGADDPDSMNPDSVDSENARRFAPVDTQPAPTSVPAPPATSIPLPPAEPPTSEPPTSEPPTSELPPPVGVPTPVGAPTGQPPAPPGFGGVNECDVLFPNPAIIVWGVEDSNPDNGLWVHEGPSYDSPQLRLLNEDAMTGFMTAGCRLGDDGTPWFEFGSSSGGLGYADSTYLRFSQLACLVGIVEARDPAGTITAIWNGPVEGHAYSDGGALAAFIPNSQLGSGQPYRLVPSESVILVESTGRALCDLSDREQELGAALAAPSARPPYRGDCVTGPVAQFGPALLVDIDGVVPIDAVMLTATQPVGEAVFATMTVLIGAEESGRCSWRDVANLYSGPLDRDDGEQDQHAWSCFENGSVQFVQYVFDADPVGGSTVTTLTLVDGHMQVESSGIVTEPIDTTSTCFISG